MKMLQMSIWQKKLGELTAYEEAIQKRGYYIQ